MSGEAYIQIILNQLNNVAVRGKEDMERLLTSIQLLENLKKDIVDHKEPETVDAPENV